MEFRIDFLDNGVYILFFCGKIEFLPKKLSEDVPQ